MIPGLSSAAHGQLHSFEHALGLPLGEVGGAYVRYRRSAFRVTCHDRNSWTPEPDYDWRQDLDNARTMLELAMRALSPKARRQFQAMIDPLDAAYESWTLNNPFAPPELPWWLRRIGSLE
ncbi:hypothetical protein [Spirillospora sp. NBC_01491]|uniref:hypothetical protein n=1 Tax=Spirillospora sp. NBC_01491 TaxID=2976007 RepID=UPI002E346632|nr:hypothetical protein [Spirillospora sp. NBC_01491]